MSNRFLAQYGFYTISDSTFALAHEDTCYLARYAYLLQSAVVAFRAVRVVELLLH
jgi:hypothetical protein